MFWKNYVVKYIYEKSVNRDLQGLLYFCVINKEGGIYMKHDTLEGKAKTKMG